MTSLLERFTPKDQMTFSIMVREGIVPSSTLTGLDEEGLIDIYYSLSEGDRRYIERERIVWDFVDSLVGDPYKNTITFLEGDKGSGKTLTTTAIAYHIKKIYDIPIVCVGTSLGLNKETFGEFLFIDERQFIDNLLEISKISAEITSEQSSKIINELFLKHGVVLGGALLIFDESYKFFDCRRPSDKLVITFGYFVSMSRHFESNLLIASPSRNDVDKRIRRQVDFYAPCSMNRARNIATVRLLSQHGLEPKKLSVNLDNYKHMYETKQVVGINRRQLNIKGL